MRAVLVAWLGCLAPACAGDVSSVAPDARSDGSDASVDDAPGETLTVMTFNIKSARDSSLEAIAAVINEAGPEIVAVQEVDVETMRTGMVNQPHRLGQLTGMANLFRTAIPYQGGSYGLAVLSRRPILTSTRTALTSVGEQRILMTVEIELDPGRTITIANTHFGLDTESRQAQAGEVIAALGDDPDVLLFGDFNEEPSGPAITQLGQVFDDAWALSGKGDGFTIPVTTPTRRIDYIFLGRDWAAPLDIRVLDTQASDHLPILATLPRR